jgi:predicted nucleic acid-binding protein
MPRVAVDERILDAAIDIQSAMVALGTHRAPSPADLILAACAATHGLTVLHYDKDFDLIAQATGQPVEWLAAPGSIP